jgi:ATPase subunit of ABC transporter with duplicated ATPase domains
VNLIDARNIDKSLGGRRVLRDAHLTVAEGERVVLVGSNGSGKSTLLHVIAGVLDPDDGTITRAPNLDIGFAPEKPDLPEHLVVAEWIDTIDALKRARSRDEGPSFGVSEFRRKKTTALSLGQKQRVSLAAAWLGGPNLLILDEPTNALDAATREDVIARIRASTAVIATHDRELAAAVATRVVEMGQ